ncbi:MAG: type I restriction enzyme HsdR N-terminal domain-containing protein [Proteobacteria bacterium]|nr:type I restriction enzyme HsdR N-terminal domain-containing protein [Pseudomonadota bacterium]
MPPHAFYELNPKVYLFGKSSQQPEERVRQWVLFELLSTYGISIQNIKIEQSVKVGTRTHYADIVIFREKLPHVVIECKRRKDNKVEAGLDQAISYASANSIQAEYAVYANGGDWLARRKVGKEWVAIPDIPKRSDTPQVVGLQELLSALDELRPALYWFNRAVPPEEAQAFFGVLQIAFSGASFLSEDCDKELLVAADYLLRVLSSASIAQDENYAYAKLKGAFDCLASYLATFKKDVSIPDYHYKLRELIILPQMHLDQLVMDTHGIISADTILSRFILALLHYLHTLHDQARSAKRFTYHEVPEVLTSELGDLLAFFFEIKLGVTFPDKLSHMDISAIRASCKNDWQKFCSGFVK